MDALFQKFEDYYIPKCNLIIERRNFFTRSPHISEIIDTYVTELKHLASICEFGDILDGMLTYRIVEGIRSDAVRDRLLRQGADLTMVHAVDVCRTEEITEEQMKALTEQVSDDGAVHRKKITSFQSISRNRKPSQEIFPVSEATLFNKNNQINA